MNQPTEDATETEIVDRARAGDERSFEMLFDRYYDMIHAFAFRVSLQEGEADDIAQETFIRAARGVAGFKGNASFKNWLHRIAHRVMTDSYRSAARREKREVELAGETEVRAQARPADFGPIHAALHQLPPDWREAVALVYFDAMSHAEAAAVLGCAEATVSWRIFRAKRALGKLLRAGGMA
jgi:RNA polymerase sigma-70 factor (ECF subfamily)